MEITWHGHSSVRLLSRDVALLTDPNPDIQGDLQADIVAVSCDYPSHSAHKSVGGQPRVLEGPGQYEVSGYNITAIGTALNDAEESRRINTVYVIRSEGVSVCHLGSLNATLTSRQLESLGSVDVLVAPASGEGTLDAKAISRIVSVLSPGIVIPVHYDAEQGEEGFATAQALLTEMNVEPPETQIRLNVTQNNVPRETRVTLLRDLSGG